MRTNTKKFLLILVVGVLLTLGTYMADRLQRVSLSVGAREDGTTGTLQAAFEMLDENVLILAQVNTALIVICIIISIILFARSDK